MSAPDPDGDQLEPALRPPTRSVELNQFDDSEAGLLHQPQACLCRQIGQRDDEGDVVGNLNSSGEEFSHEGRAAAKGREGRFPELLSPGEGRRGAQGRGKGITWPLGSAPAQRKAGAPIYHPMTPSCARPCMAEPAVPGNGRALIAQPQRRGRSACPSPLGRRYPRIRGDLGSLCLLLYRCLKGTGPSAPTEARLLRCWKTRRLAAAGRKAARARPKRERWASASCPLVERRLLNS